MSDVNINTSWTTVTNSYKAYQNTLTLYALDSNSNILCGVQQTPPTAGYTTADGLSTYLQGTTLNKGYDGKWIKTSLSSNTDANMTTFVYYMSNKLNDYDISNTRCYIQFKNTYGFPISSWALLTDDSTEIASGNDISSDDYLEINFINDYDTVNFKLKITLSGEPSSIGYWLYCPYGNSYYSFDTYNFRIYTEFPNGVFFTMIGNYWYYATFDTEAPETNIVLRGMFRQANGGSWYGGNSNYSLTPLNATWSDGGYLYRSSNNGFSGSPGSYFKQLLTYTGCNGYSTLSEALTALYGGTFGVSTTTLDNYVGTLLECKMFSDISQTFPGPNSDVEGGTVGTFDDTTDTVVLPNLPTTDGIEVSDNKSVSPFSIFSLTSSQYEFVRKCLFNTDVITNIKNFFTRPIDGIISLGRFPFYATSTYTSIPIYIGSVELTYSNTIATGTVIDRYQSINCGSVEILPYWDTALDYNPYTQVIINLPFVGRKQLNTDLVMGKTINVTYHVDMITGGCIAYVTANNDLLEQFTGNMMTVAPLSGEDFSRVYGALLTSVASSTISAVSSGSPATAVAGAVTGVANTALHSKRDFSGNSSTGGSTALLENLQPFIEIIRPITSKPRDYASYKGYVSTVTELLSNCSGYTEVIDIHLDNIPATDTEKDEISALLHSGVII